ncbi:MAG TPA: hypothetical protein VIT92_05365, partial [Burkholderiaceae bacterium]
MNRFQFNLARLLLATLTAGCCATAAATPPIAPNGTHVARWWQWALGTPNLIESLDQGGTRCRVGQSGDIWFLAGSFNSGQVRRTCYIPQGKTLFFPLITMSYWPDEPGPAETCARSIARAGFNNDTATGLHASIDGKPLPAAALRRIGTQQCFTVVDRATPSKAANVHDMAAADGYWVMLPPLPKGRYTLRFGGRYNWPGDDFGVSVQDIGYEL